MDREQEAWARVVVCVSRSKIVVLGQPASGPGRSLSINRVNLNEMIETEDNGSDEHFGSVYRGVGLLGFMELKGGTYLGLIARANMEGHLGLNRKVYSIQEVDWIPVSFGLSSPSKQDTRHISLINNLIKGGDFYFSPSLNLSGPNNRFQWNYSHVSLLSPSVSPEWTVNVIHGSFKSFSFSSLNRRFQFVLVARRSRFFAGTRYRKRGLNPRGDCANEVETEQLFYQFGPPDIVCSFKHLRGSVPLEWSQDANSLMGRPEIVLKNFDLALQATRMHFNDLKERYGVPILPVSLLMAKEGSGEANLAAEYEEALQRLNIEGVEPLVKFDLKGASSDHGDPGNPQLSSLSMYNEALPIAKRLTDACGWSIEGDKETRKQNGIIRSNCIDCLDRTSIFQYIVGLEVLNQQLVFYGLLDESYRYRPVWATTTSHLPASTSAVLRHIEAMFEGVSDQLAQQYAGTAAHKKYSSGSSSSRQSSFDGGLISTGRELFISISRHYSSTFNDNDKQHAMNLFLHMYKNVWDQVVNDEDVCAVEGIDKYVHQRMTETTPPKQRPNQSAGPPPPIASFQESVPTEPEWTQVFFHPSVIQAPEFQPS